MTAAAGESSGIDRRMWIPLAAMSLGVFVVANDFTALSVAVVDIEADLDSTLNRAQWVINAYTVVFGVMIVTGGRLADLFGRRRIFFAGAGIFAVFSLLGGLAPNIGLLIAARAAMGVGGALMWPSALGMVYAILPEDKAGLAGGLVIGVAGLGNAMGPLNAGLLSDAFGWQWIFFINVPVAVAAVVAIARTVPESDPVEHVGLDYAGILVLSAAVISFLIGLDQGTVVGFGDPVVVATMVFGALAGVAFVFVERSRGSVALVPPRMVRSPQFTSAVGSVVLLSATFFGTLVYIPQFTENVLDWSVLAAGAGLLPMMAVFGAVSFGAGPMYNRLGAKAVVGGGAVSLVGGSAWLAATIGSTFAVLVPGMVLVGIGAGLFYSAVTTVAVTAVDEADSGLAGGILYMGNVVGGSIGIGINTAIVLAAAELSDGIRHAFIFNTALGVVGTVVVLVKVGGRVRGFHPLHRVHHRAHG